MKWTCQACNAVNAQFAAECHNCQASTHELYFENLKEAGLICDYKFDQANRTVYIKLVQAIKFMPINIVIEAIDTKA